MSHKNHGDFLPGYGEQSDDYEDGDVKYGKCFCCCQEQTVFRVMSDQPSEESSIKEKDMKDGFTTPSLPQPKWYPRIDYKAMREEGGNVSSEKPPLSPQKEEGPCCLCCPRAPGYVMKRKSSTEMNQKRDTQFNPMEEKKYQYYPMEEKKYQEYPMEKKYQFNPSDGKMHQSNPLERKKNLQSTCCPLCDHNDRLMEFIRKKSGDKPKEDNGQPLFYSNLCKAYQRLMHDYYLAPPGVSRSSANRPGTF